jgi:hypothetical protein
MRGQAARRALRVQDHCRGRTAAIRHASANAGFPGAEKATDGAGRSGYADRPSALRL